MTDLYIFNGHLLVKKGTEAALLKKIFETLKIEFIFCDTFDPDYIAYLCSQGFMPMAVLVQGQYYLLIKYHFRRMIIHTREFRFSKSLCKKSANYNLIINTDFKSCIDHINQQYSDCWIYPPLAEAFTYLNRQHHHGVAFHSIELREENQLLAGEIGYTTGSIYASLSGFYTKSGTGSLQLQGLAALLKRSGFTIWDLGMEMPYKSTLGAIAYERHSFITNFQNAQKTKASFSNKNYELKALLTEARD